MSKNFKKIVAVLCSIAMIVCSVTVYNTTTIKADAPEWSTINWATDVSGGQYNQKYKFYSDNENVKFDVIQKPAFAEQAGMYTIFTTDVKLTCSLNETMYVKSGAALLFYVSEFTAQETEFTVTDANGTYTIYVYNVDGTTGEEPTENPDAPAAPINVSATLDEAEENCEITFDEVEGATSYNLYVDGTLKQKNFISGTSVATEYLGLSTGKSVKIAITAVKDMEGESLESQKSSAVTVKIEGVPGKVVGLVANINDLKTNYTIAFASVTGATSYNFYVNGELKGTVTNGGVKTIEELGLTAGETYDFQVAAVNSKGEGEKSDVVKVTIPDTSTEEPDKPVVDDEVDPETITDWTPVTNSTTLSYYIAGDKADKVSVKPEMHGENFYAAYTIAAVFKSVTLNDEAITPRGGADIEIPQTSFTKEYNKLVVLDYYGKESVTIYVKAPVTTTTTYTVQIDKEEPVVVNEGEEYTLPENADITGYYDGTNLYKPGKTVTVTSDMNLTSVTVQMKMTEGAGIRLNNPSGLRFQTTISMTTGSTDKEYSLDNFLNNVVTKTGTLITTADNSGVTLDSTYTKLNIENQGWYNDTPGVYCGSIVNIQKSNYSKDFVARGYAEIKFANADAEIIYANVSVARNVKQVATLIKTSDDYDTRYTESAKKIIEEFANGSAE